MVQTLKVRGTKDFSADSFDPTVGTIQFVNRAGSTSTAIFAASQFNDVDISTSLFLKGTDGVNNIIVIGGTVDALTWNIVNWNVAKDRITFQGTDDADTVRGTFLRDFIDLGNGDDTIKLGLGSDVMKGGSGTDRFTILAGNVVDGGDLFDGGGGERDTIVVDLDVFGAVSLNAVSLLDIEELEFKSSALVSLQSAQIGIKADKILTVSGSADADHLLVSGAKIDLSLVTFKDWSTNDVIELQGTGGANEATGSAQDDTFIGSSGIDQYQGLGGNDLFRFSETDVKSGEKIDGGAGDADTIVFDSDQVSFTTNLSVVSLANVEAVGFGNSNLETSFGTIKVAGKQIGAGATLNTVLSDIDGTNGINVVKLIVTGKAVDIAEVSFVGWTGADQITINGTGGADSLIAPQLLSTVINGKAGADTIVASGADDFIKGGGGVDIMSGNDGIDMFVYGSLGESGVGSGKRDKITDFLSGNSRFDFEAIDAIKSTAVDDAFTFIGQQAFSGNGGEIRFAKNTGLGITIVALDVDGGGADMQIELAGLIDVVDLGFKL
jgi:hypothetical protein